MPHHLLVGKQYVQGKSGASWGQRGFKVFFFLIPNKVILALMRYR